MAEAGARIRFFHAADLPSSAAAALQILRTAAEIARTGRPVTIHTGRRLRPRDEIEAAYGIALPPTLHLVPLLPHPRLPAPLAAWRMGHHLPPLRAGEAWIARGAVAKHLAALPAACRAPLIYEMHNIAALRQAEKRLGRLVAPHELTAPAVARDLRAEASVTAAADGLVFLTEAVAREARALLGADGPSIVLPSGTEVPDVLPDPSGPAVDVVYAGKIEARKGVYLLLDALSRLPGVTAVVVGGTGDALALLRARVRELGLSERVSCTGWIAPADVPPLLRRGRIAACPLVAGVDHVSDRASSPMKLLQAMGLCVPVVASDLPPVRAIAAGGDAARLVPPNDPAAFAAAIADLLANAQARRALARTGREVARRYAWPSRASRLAAFADRVASGMAMERQTQP